MFTQGLDNSALRWVKEKKEVPISGTDNLRPRIDPMSHLNRGGRGGFGLPPASKFRSGHLPPTAIPAPRPVPGDNSASASENDMSTDSDEDGYGSKYSLDSSPPRRLPNSASAPARREDPHYSSDYYTQSDVGSSMETVAGFGKFRNGSMSSAVGNGRYRPGHVYTEDDSDDSASSSEFSTTQVGGFSVINGEAVKRNRFSEGYASSILSMANVETASEKGLQHSRKVHNVKVADDDDVPSAPPFGGFRQEIRQASGEIAAPQMNGIAKTTDLPGVKNVAESTEPKDKCATDQSKQFVRPSVGSETVTSSSLARVPTFHASAQGPWHSVVAYDACVRLCLHSWAMECMEAPMFLENECALLRDAFGLRQALLQSEEELMAKQTSELAGEKAAPKPKKVVGKMKVQVRKVKLALDPPTGCSIISYRPSIKMGKIKHHLSNFQLAMASGWNTLRKIRVSPRLPANGSFSRQSLAYVHAGTRYIKQVSGLLKSSVTTTLRSSSSSYDVVQETYACFLRLKNSSEEDGVRLQPGSGETHVFFPDSLGDDLNVEIQDSKGNHVGRVLVQVSTVADDPADKLRWWSVYCEPEHAFVGKLQLYIMYSTSSDDNNSHLKCGSVAETVAYDMVLEVAMKLQHFQQRNLLLHGPWKWLLTEFAAYYGVSDVYTKLRYLSYIMDVATPTADCLTLVHDLMAPVLLKGHSKKTLSHQENRILGETKDQIEEILSLAFENYKSLDESSLSGIMEVFKPAIGAAAPALEPAVKLYTLLHDILSPEAQNTMCHYFQVAARKRSRRHLTETDEYINNNTEATLMDNVTMTTAYQKMRSLCMNIRNEILTDIQIHNTHILPSFIDLPNLLSSIYSTELCSRLRAFLIACPPTGPSPPVAELVIATADFQRDIASWGISPVKGGVDAKELFHLYIMVWIQDKRLTLLESCKLDKVKWSGVRTQHSTTPFVDEMYDRLKETLIDYEIIICRWPEYTFVLEQAVADVEKAIMEALDKQYADELSPLKENLTPKKFGFKYMQKLTKRSVVAYSVPDELGILLNSLKRMIDVLRPKIEAQFKAWGSCIPDGGSAVPGERFSEVTVMLRAKFRNYIQAVVEKLAENSKAQSVTKLKKILQDSKETVVESDVRSRMQSLREQIGSTMNHLHTVFESHVFVATCRGYWDRMGQDVLSFLENRKENRSWYKGSRIALSILDDTFASQMQQLLGNALQDKDVEPPRAIMEVRSILCKDAPDRKDNYYF